MPQVKIPVEGRRTPRVQTINDEPSMTIQSQRDQSEIREILRRHSVTGVADLLAQSQLTYQDVSEFEDFADVMRQRREAESKFMTLPSKVREVFLHDADVWLDAAMDGLTEAQIARLTDLGVLGDAPTPRGHDPRPEAPVAPPEAPADA